MFQVYMRLFVAYEHVSYMVIPCDSGNTCKDRKVCTQGKKQALSRP